ncbi:hypothetical protein Tco_0054501 [Tanacetum coccineum]
MKSIKEGPFQMGTVTESAVQQGPVRARVLKDLSAEKKRIGVVKCKEQAMVQELGKVVVQVSTEQRRHDNQGQAKPISQQHVTDLGAHSTAEISSSKTKRAFKISDYFNDKMLLMQALQEK